MGKKVAIIIPFRDSFKNRERYAQLNALRKSIKTICEKHNQEYVVLVIRQNFDNLFNKAYLMNIGVDISQKEADYFIFNDVDHVSLNVNNVYRKRDVSGCLVYKQNDIIYSGDFFGGAIHIKSQDYFKINGFCNYFWGWGWEDGAIRERLKKKNVPIKRFDGIFKTLIHETKHRYMGNINFINNAIIYNVVNTKINDGFNSIRYKIMSAKNISDNVKMYDVQIPKPQYDVNSYLSNEQICKMIKGKFDEKTVSDLILQYQIK